VPRGGERIGDAYVRIHADGRQIDREIRDVFDNAEFDKEGEARAGEFWDAYADQSEKEIDRKKIFAGLERAWGKTWARNDQLSDQFLLDLRRKIVHFAPNADIGDRIFTQIGDSLERGLLNHESLTEDFFTKRLPAMTSKAWGDVLSEAYQLNAEFDADLRELRDRQFEEEVKRLHAEQVERERAVSQARVDLRSLEAEFDRLVKGQGRWNESTRDVTKGLKDLRITMHQLSLVDKDVERDFLRMRARLITLTPRINRANHEWGRMSDLVGRMTGRGSRNNFLNFIGSVNRNLLRLTGTVVTGTAKMAVGMFNFAKSIPEFFTDPKVLGQVLLNFGTAAANIVPSLIALAAGIALVVVSGGLLSSLLVGVLGIVTALASTIAFSLVAAVGALGGAFAALLPIIGTVIGAVQALSKKELKELREQAEPLINAFKALGDSAADVLFRDIGKWAKMAAPLLRDLIPVVEGIARGIREGVGNALEQVTKSSAWDEFVNKLKNRLPEISERFVDIAANILGGLGGAFLGVLPLVRRFLRWLEKVTREFREWANSPEGQNEIKDFFRDAANSAESLWGFIKEVGRAIGNLFEGTNTSGNNIFDDMTAAVKDFNEWVTSPEGEQAIADWALFAEDLAKDLGNAALAVTDLIDALDSPSARRNLSEVLTVITGITTGITNIVNDLEKIGGLTEIFKQGFKFGSLANTGGQIGFIATKWGEMTRKSSKFHDALNKIPGLIKDITFSTVQRQVDKFKEALGDLPGRIRQIPVVGNIFSKVQKFYDTFKEGMKQLPKFIDTLPDVDDLFKIVERALGTFLGHLRNLWTVLQRTPQIPNPFSGAISGILDLLGYVGRLIEALGRLSGLLPTLTRAEGALARGRETASNQEQQGQGNGGGGSGVQTTPARVPAITVVSPVADPRAVAQEVGNIILGMSY
jgi:hypothetical protein